MTTKHGLYINGHGNTNPEVFCFVPPLFTEVAMAENYGRLLKDMRCKYSKQPVFTMINDVNVSLVGQLHMLLSDNTAALGFPVMSHTGIAIVSKASQPSVSWSTKLENANIFDFFTEGSTRQMAYILRYLDMRINPVTGDITASTSYPPELYDLQIDTIEPDEVPAELNKLMALRHKKQPETISTKDLQVADQYLKANPTSQTTPEGSYNMRIFKRLAYIGYVNEQFLKAIGIKPDNMFADIYKYLLPDYLAEHADKLLVDKVIHINTDPKTSPKFLDYLHTNKYTVGISCILNQLKANLIEARLMESTNKPQFKLWCSTCRSLASVDERKSKYNTIKSIFEPRESVPKSVRQFAMDNTRELRPEGAEKFSGVLSPHIVITNILYPCFLYCMESEACDLLPEFTDEIHELFQYIIVNLPLYTLNKPSVMRFIELVTPNLVDAMITSVIWSSSEPIKYTSLLTAAFTTLASPYYKYTVEDIILVYGVVIYNMPTYLDFSSASYRTASDIHPHEYQSPHATTVANTNETTYGTIWNLPNNSHTQSSDNNTWLEPVMSKKQRKYLAKQLRRTKRQLNIPSGKRTELSGNNLIKIATATILKGKYPYLTQTIRKNPEKYIPRMFHMVTRFNV